MLTARQQEIWNYLVEYVDRHGYPPTVREIGEEVGLASPSTVHAHLANLERAGLLRRDPTKPRALELIGRQKSATAAGERDDLQRLPLLGEIAAGGPLLADQNIEDYVELPERIAKGDFLLRVKGDSMVDAGILDGDVVVVRRQQDARDGEIVVALAGDDETADEATVKTFYRENGRIRLQPENASLEPIYARHVQVLGRVRRVAWLRPRRATCRLGRRGSGNVAPLNRTLEQELLALLRGVSLECPACGEFVMHARDSIFCPECGLQIENPDAALARGRAG